MELCKTNIVFSYYISLFWLYENKNGNIPIKLTNGGFYRDSRIKQLTGKRKESLPIASQTLAETPEFSSIP